MKASKSELPPIRNVSAAGTIEPMSALMPNIRRCAAVASAICSEPAKRGAQRNGDTRYQWEARWQAKQQPAERRPRHVAVVGSGASGDFDRSAFESRRDAHVRI